MSGNFLGFPKGTMGSCGGYMVVCFHQLQTLDQLSGRPRILREAGEARREKNSASFVTSVIPSLCANGSVCKKIVHAGTGDTVEGLW